MHLSTQVLDVRADEAGITIQHRSTEPRLDESLPATDESRFDKVVVCSGVLSRDLGHSLGDRVNVYPVKGYSITVNLPEPADQAAAPWVSLLDDKAKIVTSRLGRTRFRVAGTAEFNGVNRDIRAERVEPPVRWCRAHFPGMSTRQAVPWAGLRPMMPDMMPCVMQGRNKRVFYNTGHGHLGWTLSAATADAVAALATGRANAA
jgi:D-amino-acid dehydrogenase